MATENDNEKGVSPQRPKGGARRWYGAARGLAIAVPFALLLAPFALAVDAYTPLFVAAVAAVVGVLTPGRSHAGKSAWRTVRESLAWFLAASHLVVVGLWLYSATGCFGCKFNASFQESVKDADRVVIRDGGGLCHSDPDKEPSLFEITNKADIAAFNNMFKFSGQTMPCMCCGYPGIDWWRDGRRVVVSALHHGHALRVEGFVGDLRLTAVSRRRIKKWLEENCGVTKDHASPLHEDCRQNRILLEFTAKGLVPVNEGKRPTLDDLREEFKKNGKAFPSCPAGGEYSLTYGEDGTPEVKCTAPRHD